MKYNIKGKIGAFLMIAFCIAMIAGTFAVKGMWEGVLIDMANKNLEAGQPLFTVEKFAEMWPQIREELIKGDASLANTIPATFAELKSMINGYLTTVMAVFGVIIALVLAGGFIKPIRIVAGIVCILTVIGIIPGILILVGGKSNANRPITVGQSFQ